MKPENWELINGLVKVKKLTLDRFQNMPTDEIGDSIKNIIESVIMSSQTDIVILETMLNSEKKDGT